jgi:hypothetical protein
MLRDKIIKIFVKVYNFFNAFDMEYKKTLIAPARRR